MDLWLILVLAAVVALLGLALVVFLLFSLARLVFRAVARPRSDDRVESCPVCESSLRHGHSCAVCGYSRTLRPADRAMAVALRQVELLFQDRQIDAQTRRELRAAMRRKRGRVTQPAASQRAAPVAPAELETPVDVQPEIIAAERVPPVASQRPQVAPSGTSEQTGVEQRVERYLTHREGWSKLEQTPQPPATPQRSWHELLDGFLQQSNIRWGELVGGLLIVSCSVALVVSFWSEISRQPLLKFSVLNGTTASLFGLGIHAARRWKLPTTSQGLLLTAVLLVPLNFLAIAAFSESGAEPMALVLGGHIASVLLFAWLLWLAAAILVPIRPWALVAGVLGLSIVELIIGRTAAPGMSALVLYGLSTLGLGVYAGSNAAVIGAAVQSDRPSSPSGRSVAVLVVLGATSFAVALAMGLLLYESRAVSVTMQRVSPFLPLFALAPLASGVVLWRFLGPRGVVEFQTAGAAVTLAGLGLMLLAIAVAWPLPVYVLATSALAFAVLTAVGFVFQRPEVQIPAVACATLAIIVGVHLAAGNVDVDATTTSMLGALLSATTGNILSGITLALVLASAGLARLRRLGDSGIYLWCALGTAAAALGLSTWYGWGRAGDPAGAFWNYLFLAAMALAAAVVLRMPPAAWIGGTVWLAATIQAVVYRWPELGGDFPWVGALLWHGGVMIGLAAATASHLRLAILRLPLTWCSLATSLFALLLLAASVRHATSETLAPYLFALAAVWLVASLVTGRQEWFVAFQAVLALAVLLVVDAWLQQKPWCVRPADRLLDPRAWQAHGLMLALLACIWAIARPVLGRLRMPQPDSRFVERVFLGGSVMLLVMLAVYAATPGAAQELSPQPGPWGAAAQRSAAPIEHFELWGTPHRPAAQWPTWALLLFLAVQLWVPRQRQWNSWDLQTGVMVVVMAVPLLSYWWEPQVSVASAFRWLAAAGFGAASIAGWTAAQWIGDGSRSARRDHFRRQLQPIVVLLVVLLVLPLVVMSLLVLGQAVSQQGIVGPEPDSPFGRLGYSLSYAVPLVCAAATLVGHALYVRSPQIALAAGMLLHLAATAAFLLAPSLPLSGRDMDFWIQLAQINATVAGAYGLAWIVYAWWRRRPHFVWGPAAWPMMVQIAAGIVLLALALVPACLLLWWSPDQVGQLKSARGIWGWASWLAVFACLAMWHGLGGIPLSASSVGGFLAATAAVVALQRTAWDSGRWEAMHTWQGALIIAAALLMTATRFARGGLGAHRFIRQSTDSAAWIAWSITLGLILIATGLRTADGDPAAPWPSILALLSASVVFGDAGSVTGWRRWFAVASICINLAATIWWSLDGASRLGRIPPFAHYRDLVYLNIAVLAFPAVAWFWLSRASRRLNGSRSRPWAWHRVVAWTSTVWLLVTVGVLLLAQLRQVSVMPSTWLAGVALAATCCASGVALWDPDARTAWSGLYVWGLAATGMATHALRLSHDQLVWWGAIVSSAYALATSFLWSRRGQLLPMAAGLRIPQRQRDPDRLAWLVGANRLLSGLVVVLSFWAVLTLPEPAMRISASQAIIAQMIAVGLLAQTPRDPSRNIALWLGVLGGVALGLSPMPPGFQVQPTGRAIVVVAALSIVVALYGLGLAKWLREENPWLQAARRMIPVLLALLAVAIGAVLLLEIGAYARYGRVELSLPLTIAFCAALGGLAVAALVAALVPGRDPLELRPEKRSIYVYFTELVAALILVHLRLTRPELFGGVFQQYWPLAVMLIAYLGVGLSESCRRFHPVVLAKPLENTSALLPLLPVIGYWVSPPRVSYSLLMLVVGTLYAVLASLRRSLVFGILAALAANIGLWHFLARTEGLGILQHPQLWLIPPALCLMVAAHWNRDRLREGQLVSLRYLSSAVIYSASTADIFLNGVAQSPWLPLVLMGLSIAGVLAGILLRIRGFLFLGVSFLMIAMLTIIWYAAVDRQQTWIWYVVGIITGAAILALFALFERKRQDVLQIVERLREWDA